MVYCQLNLKAGDMSSISSPYAPEALAPLPSTPPRKYVCIG